MADNSRLFIEEIDFISFIELLYFQFNNGDWILVLIRSGLSSIPLRPHSSDRETDEANTGSGKHLTSSNPRNPLFINSLNTYLDNLDLYLNTIL